MKKIYFYGDSNTYGYDPRGFLGMRYPENLRWTKRVQEYYKDKYEVISGGQNGRMLPSLPREEGFIRSITENLTKEDVLFIMLGTNDILLTEHPDAKRAVEKMERLLDWFKNENVPFSIAIIGPVYIADGSFEMKRYHEESRAMNEAFKALCEKRKIPFYDAGLWGIPLGYDGVHFSEEGCIRFSEKIIDILAKTHIQGHHE